MAQDRSLKYRFELGWEHMPNALYDVDDKGYKSHTTFQYLYDQPPAVVAYVQTRTGGESIQARVQDVTVTGCRMFYQEPDHDLGTGDLGDHNDEEVTYLIMERGVWDHPTLGKMQAGIATHTGAAAWESVTFPETFDSTPAVFALLNTYNNGKFNSIRVQNVTTTGFQIRQYELKALASESVGWIALERGASGRLTSGQTFEVNSLDTGANFGPDDGAYTITYTQGYTGTPYCLVCGNTSNGEQWWSRAASAPTNTSHGTYAEEDQVSDSERSHTNETIAWFIAGSTFGEQAKFESIAPYRNVWMTDQYIYHTSTFSVDVYDSTASTKLTRIEAPSQETEMRLPVDIEIHPERTDVPMRVVISGTSHPVYTYSITGNDVHFQDGNGDELPFWIYNWTWQGVSEAYVRVPASGTEVYMLFDHSATIDFSHGSEADISLFYDDFTEIYYSNSGLSPDWVPSHEADFLVVSEKLQCSSATASYTWADVINRDFGLPIHIETKIDNINAAGGGVYSTFSHYLYAGSDRRGWHWFTGSAFSRSLYFDTGQQYQPGAGRGMNNTDTIMHSYIYEDRMRLVADRVTDPFDDTFYGPTTGAFTLARFFTNYNSTYDIDYVKITRLTDSWGTVSSGTPTQLVYQILSFPSSVWANDDTIYMGTADHGLYTAPVSSISGAEATITGTAYKKWPNITDNEIRYVHGAGDYLCVSTAEGVDRIDLTDDSRIYREIDYSYKCHQTTSGTIYHVQMSPFYGVDESVTGLGRPIQEWRYYQQLYFVPTTIENSQIIVQLSNDFPYHLTKAGGEDIRFIDENGNNLSYYIITWYPSGEILVKVPNIGTGHFYMLYGNPQASAQSNESNVYYFYDDFSTLNTDIWSVYKNHSNNYAVITDGYLNLYDYNNSGTTVITKERLPYNMKVRARIRRNGGSVSTQFDGHYGYGTTFNNRANQGYNKIDPTDGSDETKHRLYTTNGNTHGTQAMSTSWKTLEQAFTVGYQYSTYRGETLERTDPSTVYDGTAYYSFHINNSSTNPNMNVDWISFQTYPDNITITGETLDFWNILRPRLHAVYTPTVNWFASDYVYEDFYQDPVYLNDIYVSQETSSYNDSNTIFLATDRGAHIIEERQGDEENATVKRYYIA